MFSFSAVHIVSLSCALTLLLFLILISLVLTCAPLLLFFRKAVRFVYVSYVVLSTGSASSGTFLVLC